MLRFNTDPILNAKITIMLLNFIRLPPKQTTFNTLTLHSFLATELREKANKKHAIKILNLSIPNDS